MLNPVRQMPEEERRRHQAEIGLVIVTRREPQPTAEKRNMEQSQRQSAHGNTSRAQQALERMSEPPTFKEVAMHELKRAAVYVPILFSAGVGLAWTCKKLVFRVG